MLRLKRLGKPDFEHSDWLICTEDETQADFPPDSKFNTLYKKYARAGNLIVKERQQASITIRAPSGGMPQNGGFLKALWDATTFK